MINKLKAWKKLNIDQRAVTAMEYGLIAALVAVVIIGAVTTMGTKLNAVFGTINSSLGTTAASK
jgi:pilus assembly protein Flp/PilA